MCVPLEGDVSLSSPPSTRSQYPVPRTQSPRLRDHFAYTPHVECGAYLLRRTPAAAAAAPDAQAPGPRPPHADPLAG